MKLCQVHTIFVDMLLIFQGFNKITFIFGFIFGVGLAVLFYKSENGLSPRHTTYMSIPDAKTNFYGQWLAERHLTRERLDEDEISYSNNTQAILREDAFLYNEIHITCVVFVFNRKNAQMVKSSYGNRKHCNEVFFVGSFADENLPIVVFKSKSSWHHLCQTIQYVWNKQGKTIQWVLFTHDQLFAIPENLRYYVAETDYNYNDTYYLGNPMSFWGQTYNSGKSGYVLSRGTLKSFIASFNSTGGRRCSTGFNWRNEDFYLGKYLAEIGVFTTDTRDAQGRWRFHGYGLNRLLPIGGISSLDNYRKKGVYQLQEGFACCSNGTITFGATVPGDLFLFSYLTYQVRVFSRGGSRGNLPYPKPDDVVSFQELLQKMGAENVSQIQEMWKERPEDGSYN